MSIKKNTNYFEPKTYDEIISIYKDQEKYIHNLKTSEGKWIAGMCVDYLIGRKDSRDVLYSFRILDKKSDLFLKSLDPNTFMVKSPKPNL